MSEIARMTVHELAPLIERREVSPVEVTREALDRIDALDQRLRAFVTVRHEQAFAAAQAAEEEIGRGTYRGPWHGLPLGIKDNIAVAGWPTTNASALMTDNITDYDATVVARLRAAGSVIVILLWVYYSALIVYFGAEFTKVYAHEHGSHQQKYGKASRAAPASPRSLPEMRASAKTTNGHSDGPDDHAHH